MDITERWKIGASATYLHFPVGEKSGEWRISAQQRYTLAANHCYFFQFQKWRHVLV